MGDQRNTVHPFPGVWGGDMSEVTLYSPNGFLLVCLNKATLNSVSSRKPTYIILTPLNPLLYSKTGFYRVYINFLISAQKRKDCGQLLEPPQYQQSRFWAEIWKISEFFFLSENFQFLEVKFSIYLNRRVFVMNVKILFQHRHQALTTPPSPLADNVS